MLVLVLVLVLTLALLLLLLHHPLLLLNGLLLEVFFGRQQEPSNQATMRLHAYR
jgi:uncharacterized membrane protein